MFHLYACSVESLFGCFNKRFDFQRFITNYWTMYNILYYRRYKTVGVLSKLTSSWCRYREITRDIFFRDNNIKDNSCICIKFVLEHCVTWKHRSFKFYLMSTNYNGLKKTLELLCWFVTSKSVFHERNLFEPLHPPKYSHLSLKSLAFITYH